MAGQEDQFEGEPARLLMHRQAALAEAQLRLVRAELRTRQIGVVLRLAFLALILLLAMLIVAALIAAGRSPKLVVDPFDVPQAVAVTGASGEALAASVVDELNRTRGGKDVVAEAATATPLAPLRRILGSDRHIGGSVIGLEDGMLRLTIRGEGIQPRSFTGRADDLPEMSALIAEHVRGGAMQIAPSPGEQSSAPARSPAEPAGGGASAPEAAALRHDHQAARRALLNMNSTDPAAGPARELVEGLRELDLGRADRAIPPLERFDRALRASPELARLFGDDRCYLALAYARLGRTRDALRLTGSERVSARCAAFRGDVLALAGNWRKASRAYREAIALAPASPVAFERIGAALLARDEPEDAAQSFAAAVKRAPNWADPHFGLAEAMMQLGRFGEAEQHYRMAARLAPRWGALHVGWGEALWRLGRQQEARSAWAAAAGMDLGPAAKARLQQLLAFASVRPGERAESAEAQARVSASSADFGRRFVTVTFVPMSVRV